MLRVWVVAAAVTWVFGSVALGSEACDEVLQIARSKHPEMVAGRVEISACARIPGVGTKLVVRGPEDPIEAFVGPDGQNIRIVVEALDGERVDVVPHADDPALAAVYAVAPLTVRRVVIDEGAHAMDLVVVDEDLKQATGEGAFHLKLAAELTGWSLNAVSLSQDERRRDEAKATMMQVPGITVAAAEALLSSGFCNPAEIGDADPSELAAILGVSTAEASKIRSEAARLTLETVR